MAKSRFSSALRQPSQIPFGSFDSFDLFPGDRYLSITNTPTPQTSCEFSRNNTMQNQTNMDGFQKLAVVRGRKDRSGSVVSDDALDGNGNNFCYQQRGNDCDTEMVDALVGGTIVVDRNVAVSEEEKIFSRSLYGRRRNSNSMAVVTSTRFDDDECFSEVARAMIHRHQHENMGEMEAIRGTLEKADDLRSFIEALNHRCNVLDTRMDDDGNIDSDDTLSDLVFKTQSIFDSSLKALWREVDSLSTSPTTAFEPFGREDSYNRQQLHRGEMASDLDDFISSRHPKTPKNLRMSPMLMSNFNYNNHGVISQSESIDSMSSEGSNGSSIFRSLKRRRRWFFPQNKKTDRVITPVVSSSSSSSSSGILKPIPIKPSLPNFHFDFGSSSNNSTTSRKQFSGNASLVFGDAGGNKRVHSLKLDDGLASSQTSMGDRNGNATYMPPTSPIRKVSVEMKANAYIAANYS